MQVAAPARPEQSRGDGPDRERSGFLRRHRRLVMLALTAAVAVGFVIFVLPQVTSLSTTVHRLESGDPVWLVVAVLFEALSLGSYILLFRTVFSCHDVRIGWRESYQINMAGVVATKLLAAAGAGGVALTVWALRASGLAPRTIARRMFTFELLLYAVYAGSLVVCGLGLRSGLMAGHAPWTLSLAPAGLGAVVIALALALRMLPSDLERRFKTFSGARRVRRLRSRLAAAPAALRDGTGIALELIRNRDAGVLGAVGYWAFDIATLVACFHAFGSPPPGAVIVMAYFLGQLANALPLPGGVGGVEGGMIGVLIAFGTHGSLALLAVLSYRAISFWLPTLPGALAYMRLRGTVAAWRQERAETAPTT